MNNNVLKMIKYLYYFSLITLLILYLYPGSLIGYIFYGDLGKQPDIIPNPIRTSINHALAFFFLSMVSLIGHIRDKNFDKIIIFLIFLSIVLELTHNIIPNRSFQFFDLLGNLLGSFLAILIIIFYKKFKKTI